MSNWPATLLLIFTPLAVAQTVDWKAMIPAIREVLKAESKDGLSRVEQDRPIGIEKTADITGDGVPEAIVGLGTGGASTEEVTVMRIENGEPVLAIFRNRDGRLSPRDFAIGASVMHTDNLELLPQDRAVYATHYNYNSSDGKLHECGGEAYRWNAHSKTFDYNSSLTRKITKRTCREVPQTAGEAEIAK